MKMTKFAAFAAAALMMGAFASCKEDGAPSGSDVDKDLISDEVPTPGFTGDKNDGVYYFATYEQDTEEGAPYMAFRMEDGVVKQAAVNVVFDSESMAKEFAKLLNNGFSMDEDDEPEYDGPDSPFYAPARGAVAADAKVLTGLAGLKKGLTKSTRAKNVLVIPVSVKGNVVYAGLPAFKGVYVEDLEEAIYFWTEGRGTVDHLIFGTYKNNRYECHGLMGLNMDIVVDTDYDQRGICTKFETTITCPSDTWAKMMYAELQDSADSIEEEFGARPEIKLNGRTVTEKAVIIGEVTREYVNQVIYVYDWALNEPFLWIMF